MKRIARIFLGTIITLVVASMVNSCSLLFGSSIETRVRDFMSDVDSEKYTSLYLHIHPDHIQRGNAAQSIYWSGGPFGTANQDFAISSSINIVELGGGRKRADFTYNNKVANNIAAEFTMQEKESGNWYIIGIMAGSPQVTVLPISMP